jgi:hypothetical protein
MARICGELVVAGRDAAKVLQLGEEPLDQVALAVESLAEARLPAPIALRRDVGRRPDTDEIEPSVSNTRCRW